MAKIEAAAAAVTDVEGAAQFGVDLVGIGEIRVLPVDDVAGRRIQAAFTSCSKPRPIAARRARQLAGKATTAAISTMVASTPTRPAANAMDWP